MSDQEGVAEKFALSVVGLLVITIVASVVGFGAYQASPSRKAQAAAPALAAPEPALAEVEHLYFAVGEVSLPADAGPVLERVASAARAADSAVVWVSGFHDASGNLADNQDLARRRAQQVLHALEANGVSRSQVVLNRPAQSMGGADPAEARRVDLRVQ